MMSNRKSRQWLKATFVAAALASSSSISFAVGDLTLNTFDSADELTASGNEWSGGSAVWDGTMDAGGGLGTGSMHVTCSYTDQGNGWQEVQIGRNIPWPYINLAPYVYFECDIKPDVANSFPAIDGNWCEFSPIIQQWDWTPLANTRLLGNGWIHIQTSLNPALTLAHLVADFHRTYNAYPTNTMSYWIDNVKLTVPPSPPPTLAIKKSTPPGLTIFASQAAPGGTYQRQIIRTADAGNSFHTSTAQGPTTTYTMTITNFPSTTYAGFIAQSFLVPQYINGDVNRTNMQYGPTDSSIDWNSGNVIYWTIGLGANGTAYSDFRIKTNEFGGQDMAQNNVVNGPYGTNGYPVGHLAALQAPGGVLGTWTLSFNYNTNVTLRAPDGSVTNFVMDPTWADVFQDPLYAYFGIQPNDNARIGQSATFNLISIAGSAAPISDTFSTGALDTSMWVKSAAQAVGIQVVPQDAAFWLSWTTPDPGFTNIWCTSDISTSITNGWAELTGVPQNTWINILDRRTVLVPWSALNSALGGSETNRAFFGLWKVQD